MIEFEIGNEDRGPFASVFEPVFDNLVGEDTSDGHLSWGWRLSYTPHRTNPEWFQAMRGYFFWLDDDLVARTSSALQQFAYLPDEQREAQGFEERPHAGFLSYEERISLRGPLSTHLQRLDTLSMTLGIVGPLSGAEAVHKAAHEVTGNSSSSWSQLDNEPIVNFYYERGERLLLLKSRARENLEFMPYAGVALGNAFTYGAIGATLRLGSYLTSDSGARRLGPLLSGNNFAEDGSYVAWSVFLGAEARAVAHNIFLDGNTFSDSESVDKKTGVYDIQLGFELGWGATRLSVINLWRSEEFETQGDPDQLLKATLSYSY